jgi:hypothetical protein
MFSLHHIAEPVHTINIAGLGIEQVHDAPKVVGEIGARQVSGFEIPNPGAANEFAGAQSGIESFALTMGSHRRDRQNGRDLGRVEFVTHEPQWHRPLAARQTSSYKFPITSPRPSATVPSRHMVRHQGIKRATDVMLADKLALVCGYGNVGKGRPEHYRY